MQKVQIGNKSNVWILSIAVLVLLIVIEKLRELFTSYFIDSWDFFAVMQMIYHIVCNICPLSNKCHSFFFSEIVAKRCLF